MLIRFNQCRVRLATGATITLTGQIDASPGARVLLTGDNAAGKSTVLLTLHSLLSRRAQSGEDRYFGHIEHIDRRSVERMNTDDITSAFVFQEPRQNFICRASSDEIILPLLNENLSKETAVEKLRDLVDAADVYGKMLWRKKIDDLSSGEQQRIAIVAALVNSPNVLLWDEALARVDDLSAQRLFALLRNSFKHGILIAATHRASRYQRLIGDEPATLVKVHRSGDEITLTQFPQSETLPATSSGEINFARRTLWNKYLCEPDPTIKLFNNGVRIFGSGLDEVCSISDLEFFDRRGHEPISTLVRGVVTRRLNFAVGKNGSGKTLLLRFLAGQIPNNPFFISLWPLRAKANLSRLPTSGLEGIRRLGRSVFLPAEPIRWLTEETAKAEVELFCHGAALARRLDFLLDAGINPDAQIDNLSYGQRKLLSLLSLPEKLEIACIDEPFADLNERLFSLVEKFLDEQIASENWRCVVLSSSSDIELTPN